MTMWIPPQSARARATIAFIAPASLTSPPSAIATPPAATISATTEAAASDCPDPSRAAPRSFTTTFAPRRASSRAYARPSPPPAPVTMATWSVKVMAWDMCELLASRVVLPVNRNIHVACLSHRLWKEPLPGDERPVNPCACRTDDAIQMCKPNRAIFRGTRESP